MQKATHDEKATDERLGGMVLMQEEELRFEKLAKNAKDNRG